MSWLYSCKKASELLSMAQDEPLDTFTRWRLRAHMSVCENCREVEAQLQTLRSLTHGWSLTASRPPTRQSSVDERAPAVGLRG